MIICGNVLAVLAAILRRRRGFPAIGCHRQ